jgi:phosphoribosylamine--glycine ligase
VVARCEPIPADAPEALATLAERERVDLTIVGPEQPLALGLVDAFAARGLRVFGPTRAAAELEVSKVFAKTLFARYGIPTARFASFGEPAGARAFARELGGAVVVKADGLAAGKGAIVCADLAEAERAISDMLERRIFGAASARVVIEERLDGEELSFFALTDGEAVCPLGAAQDHKAVFDDDRGPNTGGMGAYSPPPALDPALAERILGTIVRPTVRAMASEGRPYRGVLFAGLMLTADGPKVLEYNARFGDPECQVLVVRLLADLVPLCRAVADGTGLPSAVPWRTDAAVCVVLASGGYPGSYTTGHPITGLEQAAARPGVTLFHAGTAVRDGRLVTAGGRVLGVTAVAADIPAAIDAAYAAVSDIRFEGMHCRRDIGRRALLRLSVRA